MFQTEELDLLREWVKQWNCAERAIKIAEKTNEEFPGPAVVELRYSGRKVVEFVQLSDSPKVGVEPKDKLKDAIYDCHRARHDATDHAASVIATRLEEARSEFGAKAVREVFPEYANLVAELAEVREVIANSREQRNGRGEFYLKIEGDHLPKIMKMYENFRAAEPELEKDFIRRALAGWGVSYGWLLALLVAFGAWLLPRG